MKEGQTIIKNNTGLHARPASMFVKKASEFKSDIIIAANNKEANGKSIMSVMSLGVDKGTNVSIKAEGIDEEEAVKDLIAFIKNELADRN